jgi:hypothetical protein
MPVLEKILEIKRNLAEHDRKEAMEVLTKLLYYKVAPRVAPGDSFAVFKAEIEVAEFRKNNSIDYRALTWLVEAMRAEGLIAPSLMPVTLTPLGVEKLCLESE